MWVCDKVQYLSMWGLSCHTVSWTWQYSDNFCHHQLYCFNGSSSLGKKAYTSFSHQGNPVFIVMFWFLHGVRSSDWRTWLEVSRRMVWPREHMTTPKRSRSMHSPTRQLSSWFSSFSHMHNSTHCCNHEKSLGTAQLTSNSWLTVRQSDLCGGCTTWQQK